MVECHGSLYHLQCLDGCHEGIWPADDFVPEVDEEECLLTSEFPRCPRCRGIARPNVLMFGDWDWLSQRTNAQEAHLQAWRRQVDRLLVIEVGAGSNIPTVRLMSEHVGGPLIRINPTEPQRPRGEGVSIAAAGLVALRAIAAALG
jgi:NAD-dependent SIR2 family protein deacetylase